MKALVVGYNAWDVILPCDVLPERDSKREYPRIHQGGGGPAATAAVALARLGVDVRYAGIVADDRPGLWQREELREAGVDLGFVVGEVGARSPQAVIIVDPESGERRICWSRGNLRRLRHGEIPLKALDGVDLLLCDGHEPDATVPLAGEARRLGIPVVVDGGTPRDGLADLMSVATDVIGAAGFAPGMTGLEDPAAALRTLRTMGPARVATTFGAAGCLALVDDALVHVPAFDVPVVDTTGAGDAFHAGYAWGVLRGSGFVDSLRCGAAVAALKCRSWGGRSGLPDEAEAAALLAGGSLRGDPPPRAGA